MPVLKTYSLFISHAWNYGDDYTRMVDLLQKAPDFSWRNYSCPRWDPAVDPKTKYTKAALLDSLRDQIRPVNCVLVLAGMYVAYSEWIQAEIDIATGYKKPIVGVKCWGSERIPGAVSNAANAIVGWNTSSIVQAIRDYSL